jgi:cell division protein FtsB
MRWFTATLLVLLILIQHPLWFGRGGWLNVEEYERLLRQYQISTRQFTARNAGLEAEVLDLKTGYAAIEERARFELGMIKPHEVFILIQEDPAQ